jgi:hypothetical protein
LKPAEQAASSTRCTAADQEVALVETIWVGLTC